MTYMRAADLYLGDCSSQIYEFMIHPRPCIFLDTLEQKANNQQLPYYCWNFGPVIKKSKDLKEALNSAFANHSQYIKLQKQAFDYTFTTQDMTAAERGATIIEEFTRTSIVGKKWLS